MEFVNVKISDIGEVVGGSTPSTKNPQNYDGNISWITPKDLAGYNKIYIYNGERNISERGYNSCSTKLLPKNSILFSSRAPIGYVAITAKELCTNQGFKSIIPNEKVNYKFLYYLLRYNKDYIASKGSGSTFKEISGNVMKNIELLIPKEINAQRKIAKILFDIDSKIEKNNQINDNLLEICNCIFHNFLEKNKENVVYKKITDIAKNVITGKTPSTSNNQFWNGDIPFITIPDMHNQVFTIETERYITRLGAKSLIPKNSISVSCIATIGLVSITAEESQTNQQINSIIIDKDYDLYYLYEYLSEQTDFMKSIAGGSTTYNINKNMFENMEVPYLPNQEMIKFNNNVSSMFEKILENEKENKALEQLRDTLLPKLMNGEIDLENVEI